MVILHKVQLLCLYTEKVGCRGANLFLVWYWSQRGASIGECPMFENIDDMPINMAPLEIFTKKINCEGSHEYEL